MTFFFKYQNNFGSYNINIIKEYMYIIVLRNYKFPMINEIKFFGKSLKI